MASADKSTEPTPATCAEAGAGTAFLDGRLLIAMPQMPDPRFQRSLVYLCEHSASGALGLIINRNADTVTLADLLGRLDIPLGTGVTADQPVRVGGPVETARGFVLHSSDFMLADSTMKVTDSVAMTATVEILHALAQGAGPERAFVALGYAGWGPGQLEGELRENGWLTCDADDGLLFDDAQDAKYDGALAKLGITASMIALGGRA